MIIYSAKKIKKLFFLEQYIKTIHLYVFRVVTSNRSIILKKYTEQKI